MAAMSSRGLCSAHRGLVHSLEGVVSWHSRVVQVGLLRVALWVATRLAVGSTVEIFRHLALLSSI